MGRGTRIAATVLVAVVGLCVAARTAMAGLAEPPPRSLRVDGKVVFASDRDGDYEIFVISHRATRLQQLTFNEVDDYSPSWSPDGRSIAFTRDLGELDYELMVIDADGTGERRIELSEWPETDPTWSPNGKWIAYSWGGLSTDGGDVSILNPTGERGRVVAASDENTVNHEPTWSPNSRRIAFVIWYDGSDIYVARNDGYEVRRLTRGATDYGGWYETELDWSPDGDYIGFSERDFEVPPRRLGPSYRLGLVEPKTKERDWIPTGLYSARFGAWDRSGENVVFYGKQSWDPGDDLYVTSLDAMRRVQLTTDPASDIEPDWYQPPR